MKVETRLKFAPLALIFVAAAWGFSFVIMKGPIARQDVNSFLATRFLLAVILMAAVRPSVLKKFNWPLVKAGTLAGFFLGTGYIFQTFGLKHSGAAVTGFITGLYVVSTPLIAAIFLRHKIKSITWLCVGLAAIGLGILSLNGWSIGFGEGLVTISAIVFGAHFVVLSQVSKNYETYPLTMVQLATVSLLSFLISFKDGYQTPPDNGVWGAIIFTAIFASALGFIFQTWAQSHMSPTKAAVILTLETPFAALFAVWLGGEQLTLRTIIGGGLMLLAMYLIVIFET
ncbi:MAG: hypothetical protein RL448_755 [Actinomycetota bacterium]|jgi:drug/metabolite transporter (DMT)-like permease